MSLLEILGLFWISVIIYNIIYGFIKSKQEASDEDRVITSENNVADPREIKISVEYIREHNTFYAYMANTGKFVGQGTTPEELGAIIGKKLPPRAKLIIDKIDEVKATRE